MWNPAAPQPMMNPPPPLQGAPPPGASQQFWPQWQAAVQYYQAATSTAETTSGGEQGAAGKGMGLVHVCILYTVKQMVTDVDCSTCYVDTTTKKLVAKYSCVLIVHVYACKVGLNNNQQLLP